MRKLLILTALGSFLLVSCGSTDECLKASNPAECRAWSDAGGDINDYLVGGMIGYMMANRGGQNVIVQNPNYYGPSRSLRRPILSESNQVRQLKAKVERQRVELKRQQAANLKKKTELKSYKKSSFGSSFSRPSPSSFRKK